MKKAILLIILGFIIQSCGSSSYTGPTSLSSSSSAIFQLPKADCDGDPCL